MGTSVKVTGMPISFSGTVREAVRTPADETVAGAWKVREGRPAIGEGTVKMAVAFAGTGAFDGAVNVAVTFAWESICNVGFCLTRSALKVIAAEELLGGSISAIHVEGS